MATKFVLTIFEMMRTKVRGGWARSSQKAGSLQGSKVAGAEGAQLGGLLSYLRPTQDFLAQGEQAFLAWLANAFPTAAKPNYFAVLGLIGPAP